MCGIGGILFFKGGEDLLAKKIDRLEAAQRHRGPDGQSRRIFRCHALCHQRLALLDIEGGMQPFADRSGRYHIVYNGELYNYKELKSELQGQYDFVSASDTEVVLAAWLIWGTGCLNRLLGMFSFLIWDTVAEAGFAARDPMGVKPFVYRYDGAFYFASELKALDLEPAVDEYALAEFVIAPSLSGGGEQSIFKGVRYLEPGCLMRIDKEGLTVERYYRFNWRDEVLSEGALIDQMSSAIEDSVRLSLRADVPVGVFLSGGLDSSLLAAIAARHSIYRPEAFTITFESHETLYFDPSTIVNSDDLPYARELASLLGMPMEEVITRHADLFASLRELSRINDRIPAWEQEFSQHFLSQAASQRLKAVLVGDAADETHYGYFFLLRDEINQSPGGLINRFGGGKRASLLHPDLLRRVKPLEWLDNAYRDLAAESGFAFGSDRTGDILAMSTIVHRRWLERLLHNGDIHTMNFGLEARVPFANRNMLDIASRVYPQQGFKDGVEKYILRSAASRWLPGDLAWRKKSALPRDPRPGKDYQAILTLLLDQERDFVRAYLDADALRVLCSQAELADNDRMMLFNIICLIFWAEHYVE